MGNKKRGNSEGAMGSKSKMNLMKSYKNIKRKAAPKQNKKENAQDIISKSFQKHIKTNGLKGSDGIFINLPVIRRVYNSFIMSTLKSHVQLIGNVGQEPTMAILESGKKVARFSLATNEYYKDDKGEKTQTTDWHTIVAWGKTADVIEKYVGKGKMVGVTGKLKTRTYTTDDGSQRYATEVEAKEILLLGSKNDS